MYASDVGGYNSSHMDRRFALGMTKVSRSPRYSAWRAATGKLAQLEDRRAGIIAEITLCQRPKLNQLGVMHGQKREIARWQHRSQPRKCAIYQRSKSRLQGDGRSDDSVNSFCVRGGWFRQLCHRDRQVEAKGTIL